jgi:hypothetical protein
MERALYDRIGRGYSATRQTDPRLAQLIWEALGDADTVLNVGAGAGAYEPPDRTVRRSRQSSRQARLLTSTAHQSRAQPPRLLYAAKSSHSTRVGGSVMPPS